MHVPNTLRPWVLTLAILALVAAGCGGGGGGPASEDAGSGAASDAASAPASEAASAPASEEAAAGGEFSVYIGEPEHLSPPSNVTESNGAEVLNALYAQLVEYDLENATALVGDEAPNAVAESIETDDNQTFTVTLKDGWTFHNGDPVTAQSYVDGWNYGAYGPNANTGGYFFEKIRGYDALQCEETNDAGECTADPETEEMSGLEVMDDLTFEVTLKEPFSIWPLVMGYTAFNPVPADFLDNPQKYEEAPVGNGPFMIDGSWQHNQAVNVVRYDDFGGEEPASADAVEYRIYSEVDTAYNDLLAGNLDIMDQVPAAQLEQAEAEFGDRFIRQDSTIIQYLGFPLYDDRFSEVDVRRAISMAINREAIATTVRPDFVPLQGFVPDVVPGALTDSCGGNCEFNAEEAKRLFDEAGGDTGPLTLYFNSGADHDGWIEAVGNQLRQNLGIESIEFETLDFAEYLPLLQNEQATGPWRLGWVPDYPSAHTYLDSLYGTNASSNYSGYASDEFDELISQGEQAETPEESVPFFEDAQAVLNEDMPSIPMFTSATTGAWSERVSGVEFGFFDDVNVAEITVSE